MNSTKKLTEGAMMCALVGVLLFINRQSAGFIDFAIYWLVPLPIIIYTVKYGVKDAAVVAFAMVLLSVVIGMPTGIYYTAIGVILGLLYGHAVRNDREHHELLIISCGISIISSFITMYVFASFFGYDPVEDLAYINEMVNQIAEGTGLTINQSLYDFLPKLVVLSNVLMGLLEGTMLHLLSYIVLTRFKIKIKKMRPLNMIRIPKVWGYILGIGYIVSSLSLNYGIIPMNSDAAYCIMLVCMLALMVNGYLCAMTIMAYYKKKKYVWLLLIAILPPFNMVLALLGFMDSIMNVRDNETYLKNR